MKPDDSISVIEDFIYDNYGVRIIVDRNASFMLRRDYASHIVHLKLIGHITQEDTLGDIVTGIFNEILLYPNLITMTCVNGYGERITDMTTKIKDIVVTYREKEK